jgi:formylmethanofuran dehydrogenase subunit E
MNDCNFWCDQLTNPNEVEKKIEEFLDKKYPNPYEQDYSYLECSSCGEKLYDGDVYYPELYVCEHCLKSYQVRVEIE